MTFVSLGPHLPEIEVSAAIGDPTTPYHTEVLADSPAMYLRLNESSGTNANDETANNNDGTTVGSPTWQAYGALEATTNKALTLNGTSQYLTVADSASLDVGDVFTLEAWLKLHTLGRAQWIYAKGVNAFALRLNTSNNLVLTKDGVAVIATTRDPIRDLGWHYITVTKNGATIAFRVDGVDWPWDGTNLTIANNATALHIGNDSNIAGPLHATLDELAIYPTALSTARLDAHYAAAFRSYVDLTPYLRTAEWGYGREHPLERPQPGWFRGVFDNRVRTFDRTYTSGPFFGKLKKGAKLRVLARPNSQSLSSGRWQGHIEEYVQSWPNVDGVCEIRAADAFKTLNLLNLEGQNFPAETTGDRAQRVLEIAGFRAADYDVGSGYWTVGAVTLGNVTALEHLHQVSETENGFFYVKPDGVIKFEDRHERLLTDRIVTNTIGDIDGEIRYRAFTRTDAQMSDDDEHLWNRAVITPAGGVPEEANDVPSQDEGHRVHTFERNTLATEQGEAASLAHHVVDLYADPEPRIASVNLTVPANHATVWGLILGFELSDRLRFRRRVPNAGTIEQEAYLEGVSEAADRGRSWDVNLTLSPADLRNYSYIDTGNIDSDAWIVY